MADETQTTDAAVATGNGTTRPPATEAAAAPPEQKPWFESIEDESLRAYAQVKQWATPSEAVKGAQNAEKLIGVPPDQIIRLPKANATFEERLPIYDRLGRPATAEDYKLAVPEGGDPEFAKLMGPMLHKNGITAEQAKGLNADWNAAVAGMVQANEEQLAQKQQAELTEIKTEWGGKYNERIELARRGSTLLGLNDEEINSLEDALGTGKMMRLLADLGQKLAEDSFEPGTGASNGFGMTPAQARAKMEMLEADKEWGQRYRDGGQKSAEWAEYQRLLRIANP